MGLKLSEPPKSVVEYGMLQNKDEWVSWTKDVLKTLVDALKQCSKTDKEVFVEKAALELFDEIENCGYRQGYDSAEYNYSESGGFV